MTTEKLMRLIANAKTCEEELNGLCIVATTPFLPESDAALCERDYDFNPISMPEGMNYFCEESLTVEIRDDIMDVFGDAGEEENARRVIYYMENDVFHADPLDHSQVASDYVLTEHTRVPDPQNHHEPE